MLDSSLSRRSLFGAGAATVATAMAGRLLAADEKISETIAPNLDNDRIANTPLKGRIKHSLVNWCYIKHFNDDVDQLCQAAKKLGVVSIELIDPKHWPTLKKHGLTCAIAGSHGFPKGYAVKSQWEECNAVLRERIGQCADFGVKNVISFTGMRQEGVSDEEAAKICVEGFKQIVGEAEKKGVTICLEMLNSRYDQNMIGHPGYQGDHCDYCIDIIKKVGSDHLKLLFDIYHVQIMDGDVITRLKQHKDYIAHIHTAGCPGRGELDMKQEINYPPIMETLIEIGYQGHVGHEYIPTRDAMAGLQQAVSLCDV